MLEDKKVLIIANLYHASPRIPGFAKYLKQYGWEPIVLTVPLNRKKIFGAPQKNIQDQFRVIETVGYAHEEEQYSSKILNIRNKYKKKNKIIFLFFKYSYRTARTIYKFATKYFLEWANYPDTEKDWIPIAIQAADKLIGKEEIHAILTSSSPVSCHLIGSGLQAKHRIPWVADLRDLWTQNHNYPFSPLRKFIEKKLEKKVLQNANALTTISDGWVDKLKNLHQKEFVYSVKNAFDPDYYKDIISLTTKFTITYTGQIYKQQDPCKILTAISELIEENEIVKDDFELRFYGTQNPRVNQLVETLQLERFVKYYGTVGHKEMPKIQMESHILLIFNWEDKREKNCYPLKVFEYLGAKRNIMATGGHGKDAIEDILTQTKAGVYTTSIKKIKDKIKYFLQQYQNGDYIFDGVDEEIAEYSFPKQTEKLVKCLNETASAQNDSK
jgi:glycosyltransferase involved in cell wall biosynthesis